MNACSLFAGIGGFDAGFVEAGIVPTVHVEIDAACRRVLAKHWPESVIGTDVLAIPSIVKRIRKGKPVSHDSKRLINAIRGCRIICGGFPCQDVSVAGLRAGLAGERSGLWYVFRRIVALFRPDWVVVENVPGLLSSHAGSDFAAIVSGLEKLGYCVAWRSLDAQHFGVPQRRERVFIVASLGNTSAAEVLFERESRAWNPTEGGETREDITGTLGSNASGGFRNDLDSSGAYVCGAVTSKWAKGTGAPSGDECQNLTTQPYSDRGAQENNLVAHTLTGNGHDASEDGTGRGTPLVTAYRTSGNCGVMEHGDRTAALNTATDQNQTIIAFSCKDSGNDAGGVSPTLRSMTHDGSHANGGGQVAIAAQTGVRRLTPRETVRLQGFRDDWLDGLDLSDSAKYRMCGNAVNVAVSRWIGKRLVAVDKAFQKRELDSHSFDIRYNPNWPHEA